MQLTWRYHELNENKNMPNSLDDKKQVYIILYTMLYSYGSCTAVYVWWVVAWKIPWREEPGRQQSRGSLRVGQDWATSLSRFTFMHCRRKWQPTPVSLPGESQGREPVGCRLWGRTESDTTEAPQQQQATCGCVTSTTVVLGEVCLIQFTC